MPIDRPDDTTHRPHAQPERLDQALVARALVRSRSQAADLVRRGLVRIGGNVATKPSQMVGPGDELHVAGNATRYVGRGAEKLIAALDAFGFACDARVAIDVGASTGGFTQVLLERGAGRVHAVDVGHYQLDPTLRSDPRVVVLEGVDARSIDGQVVPEPVNAIVADVSFISLRKALASALALAAPDAWLVALIKPQFEVGRDGVGKGGVVRDEHLRARAVEDVVAWLRDDMGWRIAGVLPSPITGGDGNQEYLVGAQK